MRARDRGGGGRLSAQEPDGRFDLGVGVHAGEAVETAEGYIGRAVNIAARLCAAARPGEVLVSSTVKGITQASIPVGFIPKGKRRLKGIQDPILVYAVTRDMTASARVSSRARSPSARSAWPWRAVIAIAVARGIAAPGANPAASPPASAAPSADPLPIGPLAVGWYASRRFQPPVTFHIIDQDWTANRDRPAVLSLIRDAAPRGNVTFLRVEEVIAQPCVEGGEGTQPPPGAADLLTELGKLEHLTLSGRTFAQIGAHHGRAGGGHRLAGCARGVWRTGRRLKRRSFVPATRCGAPRRRAIQAHLGRRRRPGS